MINVDFDENGRKLKIVFSTKIEDKVCNFFKSAIKGELDDVDPLINRDTKTKDEIEDLLMIFIIQINKSSNNVLGFVFEVEELNDDLSFIIKERINNVKIKHTN